MKKIIALLLLSVFPFIGFTQANKQKSKTLFHNQATVSLDAILEKEYGDCRIFNYTNVEYQLLHTYDIGSKYEDPLIVKYTATASNYLDCSESEDRKYKVEVFNIGKPKPLISFSIKASNVKFNNIHDSFFVWKTFHHSCCLSPNTVEAIDFTGKKTLVYSIDEYYTIVNDETKDAYLFGFSGTSDEEEKQGYCGKLNYSINGKTMRTIKLMVDTATNQNYYYIFNRKPIVSFITLPKDSLEQYRTEYTMYGSSMDSIPSNNKVGIRFTYIDYWASEPYKKVSYDLIIKDGEIKEKEIFLRFR